MNLQIQNYIIVKQTACNIQTIKYNFQSADLRTELGVTLVFLRKKLLK
ncbi:hypothetical protein L1283_004888 [Sphingobacterium sp. HSC-15S19]